MADISSVVGGADLYDAFQNANDYSSRARRTKVRGLNVLTGANQLALLQYIEAGGDPADLLLGSGKKVGSQFSGDPNVFKVGRSYYRRPDQQQLANLQQARESAALAAERSSYEKLKSSPFFQSLLGDVNGTSAGLAAAITQLGNQTLGGAAQSGLNLEDPVVQARVLGPVALQGFVAQRELSRRAGETGLALTRGAGSPYSELAPRGKQDLLGQLFGTEQFRFGASQFNKGNKIDILGSQAGAFNSFFENLGSSAISAGAGG